MRTLFSRRRRALVALGLAITSLVTAAAVQASTTKDYDTGTIWCGSGPRICGLTDVYLRQGGSNQVEMQVTATKAHVTGDSSSDSDHKTCFEVWTKPNLTASRPPDVTVSCRASYPQHDFSGQYPLHFINSNGTNGSQLAYTSDMASDNMKTVICRVDGVNFTRNLSGSTPNCFKDDDTTLTDAQNMMTPYYNRSWASFDSTWDGTRSEVQSWEIERLWQEAYANDLIATMHGGDNLYSLNGTYVLIMQDDGNLVLYRRSDMAALWSTGTYSYPGAYLIHQTDGNLVIYQSSCPGVNHSCWASSTGQGDSGRNNLVLGNDGVLRLYSNGWGGTVIWSKP